MEVVKLDEVFFLGLVYNASLLLAMVLLFEVFTAKFERNKSITLQIIGGFVLGIIGLAVMRTNWELIPGVIFDTRSVLLGVSGLFFGYIPTIIVTVITTLYRIYLGGSGVYMGVSVIIESALIGLIWRHFRINQLSKIKWGELYLFGLVIHVVMIFLISVLPSSIKSDVFTKIWFPVMLIYPVATLLLGALILNRLRRDIYSIELFESENKFKFLFETMSQGVVIQDIEGKIIEANEAACRILGRKLDQMIGKTSGDKDWKMIEENGTPYTSRKIPSNIALKSGKPVTNVIIGIFVPEINKYRWILTSSTPKFKEGETKPFITLTTFTDITEKVIVEKNLKQSQENYKLLFSNMLNGFAYHKVIFDKYKRPVDYEYIEMNDSYVELTGIEREKAVGKRVTQVIPDINKDTFDWIHEYGKVATGGSPLRMERFFKPLGKWYAIQAYSPKYGYFAVTFTDITARKENEEKLKKLNYEILSEKQKIEAILREMGDAVFVTDTNKKITMANKATELLFDLSENEVKNKRIDEVIPLSYESTGKKPSDLIESVFKNKKMVRPKETLVLDKKSGNKVCIDGVATPIVDNDKKLVGTVWVFRDVTKEREIDKMKSDFVSLASHQLRTPLTGIKWFAELLGENVSILPIEKIREYVEKIGESNNRMICLVNDLVNTSRVDAGKLVKVVEKQFIGEVLKEAVEAQGRIFIDKNIQVVGIDSISRELCVDIDKIQISQVFGNLFNNAAKYSQPGGDIKVEAELVGENVRVSIQDHGLGIPPAQKDKVFTKFFRGDNVSRNIPGSGLGLYLSKSIVENHGGRIWFESEENVGTTFFVELPVKQVE